MWPMPRAPISTMRKRVSVAIRQTVSGTPTSLLSEPTGATVGPAADSTLASRSFVLVLPEDPVMPMTVRSGWARSDGAGQRREPVLDVVDDDTGQVVDRAGGEGRHRPGVAGARRRTGGRPCYSPTRATYSPPGPGLARVRDHGPVDDEGAGRLLG